MSDQTQEQRFSWNLVVLFAILFSLGSVCTSSGMAQTGAPASNAPSPVPKTSPPYFTHSYRSLMQVPLQTEIKAQTPASTIPALLLNTDSTGSLATFSTLGATNTSTNAFFKSLGTNGRSCATCHETKSGMSVSAASIQARLVKSNGTDPIFAPVDGANCPIKAGSAKSHPSHYSLLINRALFRIVLPVPADAEFTVSVLSDPYGCNTDPTYSTSTNPTTGQVTQLLSVYRRSIMAANLKFKMFAAADTGDGPAIDQVTGQPLIEDPDNLHFENGNLMSDGREPTLESQAIDATLGHAQAKVSPTAAEVAQIVAYEGSIYSGQYWDRQAGHLTTLGATGGPEALAVAAPGLAAGAGESVVGNYAVWDPTKVKEPARRASIFRGEVLFNTLSFVVSNDEGINNIPGISNSFTATCSSCHSQVNGTTETASVGQHSIGTSGFGLLYGAPAPSTTLPIFLLTCNNGATTPFNGTVIQVNDPGKALITGKCADIGRFSTPQLHSLEARAPYFHDGSAATLNEVITFYNARFNIGLTAQNAADLVAFLETL